MPVSETENRTLYSSGRSVGRGMASTSHVAGAGELEGVAHQIVSTCCRRRASPDTRPGRVSSRLRRNSRPASTATGRNRSMTRSRTSAISRGALTMPVWPPSKYERSRMSVSSRVNRLQDCSAMAAHSSCSSSRPEDCMRESMPMMPFMGVRSSWLILARNSDLAWSAASAASRASSSSLVRSRTSSSRWSRWRLSSRWMPHPGPDQPGLEGLDHVVHGPQFQALGLVFLTGHDRDEDDRDVHGRRVGLEPAADFVAVHAGHHDVSSSTKSGGLGQGHLQGVGPVGGHLQIEVPAQHLGQGPDMGRGVVHHEDARSVFHIVPYAGLDSSCLSSSKSAYSRAMRRNSSRMSQKQSAMTGSKKVSLQSAMMPRALAWGNGGL